MSPGISHDPSANQVVLFHDGMIEVIALAYLCSGYSIAECNGVFPAVKSLYQPILLRCLLDQRGKGTLALDPTFGAYPCSQHPYFDP